MSDWVKGSQLIFAEWVAKGNSKGLIESNRNYLKCRYQIKIVIEHRKAVLLLNYLRYYIHDTLKVLKYPEGLIMLNAQPAQAVQAEERFDHADQISVTWGTVGSRSSHTVRDWV